MSTPQVQGLFDGPIDVVGDVHGEYGALLALLGELGYSQWGEHRAGRRLIFLGDLLDRGPDSIAVVELVDRLVRRSLAQCVLGNHELNLLRAARKDGNGWFFASDHDRADGKYPASRQAQDADRAAILEFCAQRPVALERPDLRITHACWDADSIRAVRDDGRGTLATYADFAGRLTAESIATGLKARADAEEAIYREAITDEHAAVPLLLDSARDDEIYQMGNPLRIITSGKERLATAPFFASGKWRMLERVAWWQEYEDPVPVIFGHYWRSWSATDYGAAGHPKSDAFPGKTPCEWLGMAGKAYCADFSIGARFRERRTHPNGPFKTRLAAVRWPERELVSDLGERLELSPPGS